MNILRIAFVVCIVFGCNQIDTPSISTSSTQTQVNGFMGDTVIEEPVVINTSHTMNKNEFWINQGIVAATLYCYYPESNREFGNLIIDNNGNLHSTIIDLDTILPIAERI